MIIKLILAIVIMVAFLLFSACAIVAIAWVYHPYGIKNWYRHCKNCSNVLAVGNHPPCLECEDGSELKEMDKDDIAFLRRQEGKQ